jgi:hypothetical protein
VVDNSSALGKVEILAPRQPTQADVFEHLLGGSRHCQSAKVKRGGEKRVLVQVDQVPTGQVPAEKAPAANGLRSPVLNETKSISASS